MNSPVLSTSANTFKAFFACPISSYIDPRTSKLAAEYERFIRTLHEAIRANCDETFLALEREEWGASIMPSQVCTPLDFTEMVRCDIVVAYPGLSCGVPVELGWATALGKPVLLLLREDEEYTPVIHGLVNVPGFDVTIIRMRSAGDRVDAERVALEVNEALGAGRRRWERRRVNVAADAVTL